MKKRDIINTVNSKHKWERVSTLLTLLVEDNRLPRSNRLNTYHKDINETVSIVFYDKGFVVALTNEKDTESILDFEVLSWDSADNAILNKR